MLDERKVKLMTQLALYDQTQGKEDFKISEYYRKDYAGVHILYTVLWVTIGYIAVMAKFPLFTADWFPTFQASRFMNL